MAKYAGLSFGSLAYDPFSTSAPQIEFPEEDGREHSRNQAEEAAARQRSIHRRAAQARTLSREELQIEAHMRVFRRIVAAIAIPVAAVCAVLLVMLLQSYMDLTAISNESAELEKRAAVLREENSRLEIECESAFNMENVEQTARDVIGMVKADADQVTYLRSTSEDVAMVMEAPVEETALEKTAGILQHIFARFGKR